MDEPRFFVAGATGFTGREVVRLARERGIATAAHVRPNAQALPEWCERFGAMGAAVDVTPWEDGAMTAALRAWRPTHVFALLGTTRARSRTEQRETGRETSYETVDYGLTMLLYRALDEALGAVRPRFVYLSSAGLSDREPSNAYLRARYRVEQALRAGGLPFTIARPSIITGPDRDDPRPGERAGAVVLDGALALVGALGGKKLRDRYRSTSNTELAAALIRIALDPDCEGATVASEGLR